MLPATSGAQQLPPVAEKLAKTYGIKSFGQVEAIRYTFNAQFPGVDLSRSWIWEPKTDQVIYEGRDKSGQPVKVTYKRSQLGDQAANVQGEIEPGFVNDQYWLFLPFHVVWDAGAAVEDAGTRKLPLGNGSAETIVAKYPPGAALRRATRGSFMSAPTIKSTKWSFAAADPRSPALLL